jgi:hypothetical protein
MLTVSQTSGSTATWTAAISKVALTTTRGKSRTLAASLQHLLVLTLSLQRVCDDSRVDL